jgi:hypothetical protein
MDNVKGDIDVKFHFIHSAAHTLVIFFVAVYHNTDQLIC